MAQPAPVPAGSPGTAGQDSATATATAHGAVDRSHAENVSIRPDRPGSRLPADTMMPLRLPSTPFSPGPRGEVSVVAVETSLRQRER
jgi:hypothetical protein